MFDIKNLSNVMKKIDINNIKTLYGCKIAFISSLKKIGQGEKCNKMYDNFIVRSYFSPSPAK